MIYGILLGKNPELSLAELLHYLENRSIEFKILHVKENLCIIETDIEPSLVIKDLGGTIKIGEHFDYKELIQTLKLKEKIRFGLSVYPKNKKLYNQLRNEITEMLKREKIKYTFVKPKFYGTTELKHFEVLKRILKNDGTEIMVFQDEKNYFFKTATVHNPYQFKLRDVGRPVQRVIYSIPPRLAKILVNLSAKPGDKLLDPFCGIGTILQEAMLMNIFPIGLDKDPECIKGAETNLNWIKQKYDLQVDFKLIQGDATKLSHYLEKESIDCIATEPYLGPPLKSKPKKHEAEKMLEELEKLYIKFLTEATKVLKPKGKMSLVLPNFFTNEGEEVKMDIEQMAKETGLKVLELVGGKMSIVDADEKQMTRREIVLLER